MGVPLPLQAFEALPLIVLAALLALQAARRETSSWLTWASLALVFAASSRSLHSYWLCWIAVAALSPPGVQARPLINRGVLNAVVAACLVAVVVVGCFTAAWSPPLKVMSAEALDLDGDGCFEALSVKLRGESCVEPVIAVSFGDRACYWRMVEGPAYVRPGGEASYLLKAPDPSVELPRGASFVVFVNDRRHYRLFTASGPYRA